MTKNNFWCKLGLHKWEQIDVKKERKDFGDIGKRGVEMYIIKIIGIYKCKRCPKQKESIEQENTHKNYTH